MGFLLLGITNLTHQIDPVGNHDQDDPHVFGERYQQISEILAFNHGILLVQLLHFYQAMDDVGDAFAIFGFDVI